MKRLLTRVAQATLVGVALTALPASADEEEKAFNEDTVGAVMDGIVIETPWAVSMKKDEIFVFMTIHNGGDESDTIKSISSKFADKAGIAKFEKGPMLNAKAVESLEMPKGEAISLDQDGYHLVLTGLTEEIEAGDTLPVTLEFEEAGELEVPVSFALKNY